MAEGRFLLYLVAAVLVSGVLVAGGTYWAATAYVASQRA
jgi:hypothetical protein